MPNNPKTIQIFLPDGDPKSIKIALIRTINIEVISFSRNNLEMLFRTMENRHKVGVYLLTGFNEEKEQTEVYIGEAEDVCKRLEQHNKDDKKDFWQKGYFIITNNGLFTKSHIKYLENVLYNKAKNADKVLLHNGNEPTQSYIDETIKADLDGDVYECIEILTTLLIGDNIFEKIEKRVKKESLDCDNLSQGKSIEDDDLFVCQDNKGSYAEGKYMENGFLVFKDSKSKIKLANDSFKSHSFGKLREKLIETKILIEKEDFYYFSKDYLFSSPSSASAIIFTRQSNGWLEWKNKDGKTLDEIYRNIK